MPVPPVAAAAMLPFEPGAGLRPCDSRTSLQRGFGQSAVRQGTAGFWVFSCRCHFVVLLT